MIKLQFKPRMIGALTLTLIGVFGTVTCSSSTSDTTDSTTAPTISISGSPFTYYTNTLIANITPTLGGSTPTGCSASPTLPTGLTIASTTCVISGTPTGTQGATSYTITVSNSVGSASASISITVSAPTTPTVSYSGSPYTLVVGSNITLTATLGGTTPGTCTSGTTLPTGLSINGNTCVISGTPTATSTSTAYTITATNGAGSGNQAINITVSSGNTTASTINPTTATLSGSSPFCITNVNTAMDSLLPSRIKDNFKCQVGYTSGTNYVLKSSNLPNHTSYYYCGSHAAGGTTCSTGQNPTLWAALPGANIAAGTNVIASQSLVLTIPSAPTPKSGTLSGTQAGLVAIGLTINGLAIYNNAANAPDTLATEATTFDGFNGHPQNTGIYHHHAGVPKVSVTGTDSTNNDANLIGIALDGYLIYGKKCDNATAGTGDDVTLTAPTGTSNGTSSNNTGASATSLDKLHGHTTTTLHLSTATYHYHMADDPTAGIATLMGSYFYGTPGSASN